ncbi:Lsr2 family protein [Dactylosporangium sp. NPDC000244]|uniref:histone-like nucleoid-structuring protein Lsr2 n=1 Tax=Dactylosporangium sp. NPDC000244 TaxID=3154365 RepID=UPI00331AD554
MAKRVVEELVDDLDGGRADTSVTFGMDGAHYTIDLTSANAERLRAALAPYVAAAAKIGRISHAGRGRTTTRVPVRSAADEAARNQAIRTWAREHELAVSDRGRLRQDLIVRFEAAGGR